MNFYSWWHNYEPHYTRDAVLLLVIRKGSFDPVCVSFGGVWPELHFSTRALDRGRRGANARTHFRLYCLHRRQFSVFILHF